MPRTGDALADRLALLGRRRRILAAREHERRRADRRQRVARAPSRRAPRSSRRSPRSRPRPSSRGSRARARAQSRCVRGVNQSASTASAIASMPHERTVAARCSQFSRVPKRAEVQASTRRSIRSGAFIASHMPTAPPSDRPQNETRSMPALVEDREHAAREPLDRARRADRRGSRRGPGGRSAAPRSARCSAGTCGSHIASVVPSEFESTTTGASAGPSRRENVTGPHAGVVKKTVCPSPCSLTSKR